MEKYINAEDLIRHLEDAIKECDDPNVDYEPLAYGTVLGLRYALSFAQTLSTADVAEVKHGRWLDTGSFDHHYTPIYQCSVCLKEVADGYIYLHKSCLHCGAMMDENKIK